MSSNTFVEPPLLPPRNQYRLSMHSRSSSRAPFRHHARDYDPLLRDLSPTATLRAFVSDPSELNGSDALTASIRSSSTSERALGAKAAQACLDLRTWTRELEAWEWPATFDVPDRERKKMRLSTITLNSVFSGNSLESIGNDGDTEYWGSLRSDTVKAYEQRADEISQQLEDMEVEDLKEYVLATHYRVNSRPSSRDDGIGGLSIVTDLKKLDDFTALVTAMILQALPYLQTLNRLLDIWILRLAILRSTPEYLRDLARARTDLDHGWAAIAVSHTSDPEAKHAKFDLKTMLDMKNVIEQQVGSLGQRLDRFLDDLEGREDTVPESWIDDFEQLESAYGSWVVQAERKVLENKWLEERTHERVNSSRSNSRVVSNTEVSEVAFELEEYHEDVDAAKLPIRSIDDMANPPPATDHLDDPAELHDSVITPSELSKDRTPSPNSHVLEGQSQLAKKRAAFLGEIERANSLKQSKSPPVVRPFEHASNAFTRLFKKDRSPEQMKFKRSATSRLASFSSSDDISVSDKEHKPTQTHANGMSRSSTFAVGDASHPFSKPIRGGKIPSQERPFEATQDKSSEDQMLDNARATPISIRRAKDVENLNIRSDESVSPSSRQSDGLSSPFHSPSAVQSPEHWPLPLASNAPTDSISKAKQPHPLPSDLDHDSGSGDELHTPAAPITSEHFDEMFIQTLPYASEGRPRSARGPSKSATWAAGQKRAASLPRSVRHTTAEYSQPRIPRDYSDLFATREPGASSPPQNSPSRRRQENFSRPWSRMREEQNLLAYDTGSVTGSMQSLLVSSFGIPTAGAKEADSSNLTGLDSSILTPPESLEPAGLAEDNHDGNDDGMLERPHVIKRASVPSIELFTRAQLKSIDVPRSSRQSSVSSKMTPPQTPRRSPTPSERIPTGESTGIGSLPTSYREVSSFETPPGHPSLSSNLSTNVAEAKILAVGTATPGQMSDDFQESPMGLNSSPSDGPLNVPMRKRRGKSALHNENQATRFSKPAGLPSKRAPPADPSGDNFDRHVSEVLETLPTDIRFKTRPGAETPLPRAGYPVPRPKTTHSRRTSRENSMTIAPAEYSPKKSSLASDPEVKLYHLTQAGRDEPIKLFVRLVGEGQRVMVRVGGGWADLADYLRQYAEHHGSRTVSEGGLEVQTMPHALARKVSGPVESRAKTPVPTRPDSSDSDKDWPIRSGTDALVGESTPANELGRHTTAGSTPHSSSAGSRPSTSHASRPPSRQNTGEVGLGGPSSGKKNELSEHKAKWVEDMIERAKQASAEKNKEDNPKYFGELGKVGGTRRVIFRSSSAMGHSEKSK